MLNCLFFLCDSQKRDSNTPRYEVGYKTSELFCYRYKCSLKELQLLKVVLVCSVTFTILKIHIHLI